MGLTSKKLELLIALLALASFAGTVYLWPRLSGRNWKAVLGRVGTLLLSQLLSLMALALVANNWGGFYSSFSDLFGTDQGATPAIVDHSKPASDGKGLGGVTVQDSKPVALQLGGAAAGAKGGTVEQVTVHGGSTGLNEDGYVYLPAAYKDPAYKNKKFPVVVVFTGYPGTAENLISRMKYPTIAAQAIYQKKMPPTVMVLLRPSVAMPRDNECQDIPGGPQAQTFFSQDLPRALATTYNVSTDGKAWGVIGDSTGGYCALSLAMREPNSFTAAASLSGYYKAAEDSTTGDLFGGSQALRNQANLMWRVQHLPAVPVSLLVTSSKTESDYKATEAFIKAVTAKPPFQISSLYLTSGGHNFNTWNQETPLALPWVANKLSVPSSQGA
ncbi:alpha/beta hydrolase [Streptacidiphilus neutrinimicus]|uniref:alpha/beta hydrolase n=1 Tax=Streptacidiphilus neutrinimicus TaxID=105420 RepID=UPI0005AAE801|nr:alpha/beta hydrolase-fold protein [Streptacidiphilus neutrinimicus]